MSIHVSKTKFGHVCRGFLMSFAFENLADFDLIDTTMLHASKTYHTNPGKCRFKDNNFSQLVFYCSVRQVMF